MLTYNDMKTAFKYPIMDYNVCTVFDPSHMPKRARNSIGDLSYFVDFVQKYS